MLDLLLFLVTAWAATAAGRAGLRLLRLEDGPTRLTPQGDMPADVDPLRAR